VTPGDAAGQARRCLEIVAEALRDLGAEVYDIVRTRILLRRIEDWPAVADVHRQFFADIQPATSLMQVGRFIDPDWLVEVEADAVVAGACAAPGDLSGGFDDRGVSSRTSRHLEALGMAQPQVVRDLRRIRGRVWNVEQLLKRYSLGLSKAPVRQTRDGADDGWIDRLIYEGYRTHREPFLRQVQGCFGVAVHDQERGLLFLARDWIGELPLHVLATPSAIFVANTIEDIRRAAGDEYQYRYVRAFPHSHTQEIDLSEIEPGCVSVTMRPRDAVLYFDFGRFATEAVEDSALHSAEGSLELIRSYLVSSIERRAASHGSDKQAVLLSGGLDSFSVAILMRSLDIPFEAYTLVVDADSEDVAMAREFARRLGVKHNLVPVDRAAAVATLESAVIASECYHSFNVFCAVGMVFLARHLTASGVRYAFCGEGVNEAIGDYTDWTVADPKTGRVRVLQRVDHDRLRRPEERTVLVWGHSSDVGKSNRQLGSGLAKHGISRMVKPFLKQGLALECPYLESGLLARLVAIPHDALAALGGKAGLMARMLARDMVRFGIDEQLLRACKKVRLQDASEGGRGGLTLALLEAGYDQGSVIEMFNHYFGADIDPIRDARRLAYTPA